MTEQQGQEFWRNITPISNSFKADALPEVYLSQVATDDDRYYAPFTETVGSRPLWINVKDNSWADILRAKSAGLVNRHYHPHEVFVFDVHDYIEMCRNHYAAVGLGEEYVNGLLR
ncbi:cupin domain-containing protein [Bounagaea algeriensis]